MPARHNLIVGVGGCGPFASVTAVSHSRALLRYGDYTLTGIASGLSTALIVGIQ